MKLIQAFLLVLLVAAAPGRDTFAADGAQSVDEQRTAIAKAMASQIAQCWVAPLLENAQQIVVRVRVWFKPDGTLRQDPYVLDRERLNGDENYRQAAEAVLRAVRTCTPLKLPADYYNMWSDVIMNFHPRIMLGEPAAKEQPIDGN